MSAPAQVEVGTRLPPLTVHFTREQLVRYAGASDRLQPDPLLRALRGPLGLPGVVAHGMLTMGAALRVVTDWVGDPAAVRSLLRAVHQAGRGARRCGRCRGHFRGTVAPSTVPR